MQFDKTYLTEAGRELATSTQGGLDKIQFTRAVASSHDYSASSIEDIKALTDIADVKQEVQYSRIVKKDKTTLTMRVDFPSKDVTTDYSLYTVGFYARLENGDEALYGVLPSSLPDYIPAYDGHSNINDSFQTDTTVSDTDNVLITVSQAGSLNENDLDAILVAKHVATIEDIKEHIPESLADQDKDNDFTGANRFEKDPVNASGDAYITAETAKTTLTDGKNMVADNGDASVTVDGVVYKMVDKDNVLLINPATSEVTQVPKFVKGVVLGTHTLTITDADGLCIDGLPLDIVVADEATAQSKSAEDHLHRYVTVENDEPTDATTTGATS
ncbi:hypothetical protein [Levilactobacillus lindianensis]|uniref:hypothetical protein n=1 Tax=Levilactobacillus lindianensis TaxID=2486018 RepID=UPI000F74A3DE|nr:hypothetical protein [Levilactobacillus lindianensis]